MIKSCRFVRYISGLLLLLAVNMACGAPPTASRATLIRAGTSQPVREPRPRVLIQAGELRRIQSRCGLRPMTGMPGAGEETFASHAADYQKVLKWAQANVDLPLEPGTLYLPAFIHLVSGTPNRPDAYTRCIEKQLVNMRSTVIDFDDAAAALDWCWDALDVSTRQAFAQHLVENLDSLDAADSPLSHFLFHPKLCHLAAAIALKDVWLPDSVEQRRVEHVLDSAQNYFEKTLPKYLAQLHGIAPASSLQPDFEADVAYAIELWNGYTNGRYWPEVAADLTDSLDSYFYCQSDWPSFNGALVHDFGSSAAEGPGTGSNALAAGTAEILARRTLSPVAAWYARVAQQAALPEGPAELNRRWLHILFDQPGRPTADRLEAPLARNLGNGWILMRSDWRPGATVIAFDAGQSMWLGRQHYDAGQFQIMRKGRLALDSGDDVTLAAAPAHRGAEGVGSADLPFDKYASSTVAHNCVLLSDPAIRLKEANGENWPAPGNQRLMSGDFKKLDDSIETTDRQTGRLLAFETNQYYSYAAADLARAYPEKTALLFDRHLLFVAGRYLLVMDRVVTERPQTRASWLLHLPSRPKVGGADLDSQFRRRGANNTAGIWQYPPLRDWVTTDGGEGRLYFRALLPESRKMSLVGGPQSVAHIPEGRFKGRSFVGSDENGFEYWMNPASENGGRNAWYRLGKPDDLGLTFGAGTGWGRLEIESAEKPNVSEKQPETVFVCLMIPQDRTADAPAGVETHIDNGGVTLNLAVGDLKYLVALTPRAPEAGRVTVRRDDKLIFDRKLSGTVQENRPIPTRKP